MTKKNSSEYVWDPFVRFFHWSLVVSVLLSWVTAEEIYAIHEKAGYFVLFLIALRITWGFIGSQYARFSQFLYGIEHTKLYIKSLFEGKPKHYLGHNPAGGWMIVLLMVSLIAVVVTGIQMEGYDDGPWEEVHEFFANLSLLLIMLHVAGVIFSSRVHEENLVKAMFTGKKKRSNTNV